MKGYQELAEKIIFNFDDALGVFKHKATTYSALGRLAKTGMLKKIRNNLYAIVNPTIQGVYANKFQIGSCINDQCYISHLSALEYYGYQNQVMNVVFVSSPKRFNAFEFEGITFKHVKTNSMEGVVQPPYTIKMKISELEKAIVDSIHSLDSLVELEELLNSLEFIKPINEKKILHHLEGYHVQTLYQKTAFIFSLLNENMKPSISFMEEMKSKLNKGVAYLNEEAKYRGVFIKEFQLIVPKWIIKRGLDYEV